MKKIISYFTYFISYLIPTDKKMILFVSSFDYADNGYAVFRYMIEHVEFNDYKLYWLLDNVKINEALIFEDIRKAGSHAKVMCFKRKSYWGLLISFRARYILNTCGLFNIIKYHQKDKRINMWHGMPIKKISSKTSNGDITIATSELFVPIMSKGLNIPEKNVLILGQPRNDLMFRKDLVTIDLKSNKYKTVGIWMPTFRRSNVGEYHDGVFDEEGISFVKFTQLNTLNEFLCRYHSLLIIKIHPMDILQEKEIKSYSNIMILKSSNFHNKDLYPLLGECDYLLTDYSSVSIDFEMLGKPIGFTIDNLDEYKNTRGFSLSEFPGKYLYNYDEMKTFIQNVIEKTYVAKNYGDKYNLYKDGNATSRLLKAVKIIKN